MTSAPLGGQHDLTSEVQLTAEVQMPEVLTVHYSVVGRGSPPVRLGLDVVAVTFRSSWNAPFSALIVGGEGRDRLAVGMK